MNKIKAVVNSIPKPIRDFVEGFLATCVGGAAQQVLGLDLGVAPTRLVIAAASIGAINAGISYARREGLQPVVAAATTK